MLILLMSFALSTNEVSLELFSKPPRYLHISKMIISSRLSNSLTI